MVSSTKKMLLVVLGAFLCALQSKTLAAGPLVFHEVYPDDGVSYSATEYLEIVNRTENDVTLKGWAHRSHLISSSQVRILSIHP